MKLFLNYFLGTKEQRMRFQQSMFIDHNTDLQIINKLAPHGGLIGPGDSKLHGCLKNFKILRTHAFQDAYGFMKEQCDIGPG